MANDGSYRELFDLATDSMYILDKDRQIKEINQSACMHIGYTRAELIDRNVRDFILPEYAAMQDSRFNEVQSHGFMIYESSVIHKDGSILPVEVCIREIIWDGEKAFFGVVRDIRERKKHEMQLQKSERNLNQAQAIAHIGSWTHDMEGNITWSDECYRIFGFSPETFTPNRQELYKLVYPDDVPAMQRWNDLCLSGKDPGVLEWRCVRPDGTIRHILGHGALVLGSDDRPSHMAGTVQDITDRKNTESELIKYREQLEELVKERTIELENSNKELESYSYSIAHDLRAPLRSIAGYSQIVFEDAGDKLSDLDKKHLRRIVDSATHMARLIDDILELSRVMRTEVKFKEIDLNDICSKIISTLHALDEDRHIEWRIQPGLVTYGDYDLLYIVLSNLMGNAWKFTQSRPLTLIEFGCEEQRGEKVFYVKDNGVGFDMKYINKLFGVFQRLHRQDEFAGTGIGLATVYRVINRHNGWVKIEGEIEKGATVYFSLPNNNVQTNI